ncbi:hypothetical protein EV2_024044 [Malus domestica]
MTVYFNVVKLDRNSPLADVETSRRYLKRLLPLAWSHNPLTTLKLNWNLLQNRRRMTGKAYREAFYTAEYHEHCVEVFPTSQIPGVMEADYTELLT